MDSKTLKRIDDLIEKSFQFWYDLRAKYGLGEHPISVTFYPFTYIAELSEDMANSLCKGNSRCRTILSAHYDEDDNIIKSIECGVYWSYEDLYRLLIECELDYYRAFESVKFTLRHEMGHILDYKNRFIGKNIEEWINHSSGCEQAETLIPKLRKNASYMKRMRWYLMFNSLPCERQANELVGITEQDIIDDFKRTHRK